MNFLLFIALTGLAVLATPTPKPAAEHKIQAAAAARLARRSADTDWSATCSIDNADGDVLTATCENGSGGTNVSSINLNDCLTNENGVLVYPGLVPSSSRAWLPWYTLLTGVSTETTSLLRASTSPGAEQCSQPLAQISLAMI